MHRLEHAIFTISELLEKNPEKYKKLAEQLRILASCTHNMADNPDDVTFEKWMIALKKEFD